MYLDGIPHFIAESVGVEPTREYKSREFSELVHNRSAHSPLAFQPPDYIKIDYCTWRIGLDLRNISNPVLEEDF